MKTIFVITLVIMLSSCSLADTGEVAVPVKDMTSLSNSYTEYALPENIHQNQFKHYFTFDGTDFALALRQGMNTGTLDLPEEILNNQFSAILRGNKVTKEWDIVRTFGYYGGVLETLNPYYMWQDKEGGMNDEPGALYVSLVTPTGAGSGEGVEFLLVSTDGGMTWYFKQPDDSSSFCYYFGGTYGTMLFQEYSIDYFEWSKYLEMQRQLPASDPSCVEAKKLLMIEK